ncbi:hypothetical protein MRB53_037159 [Persea americana]|nr:hypothetical protein MRB53_037159 [Persea americana]
MSNNVHDTLAQVEKARKIALGDAALYSRIVEGVLPIIGASKALELRRWGSDFLAETFASPALPAEEKQKLITVDVLQTLKGYLENPNEDTAVVRPLSPSHFVRASPRLSDSDGRRLAYVSRSWVSRFKHFLTSVCSIYHASDVSLWELVIAIKSNILKTHGQSTARRQDVLHQVHTTHRPSANARHDQGS